MELIYYKDLEKNVLLFSSTLRNFVLKNFYNRDITFDVLHTYYICARQEDKISRN
jgi:hypothetical protein